MEQLPIWIHIGTFGILLYSTFYNFSYVRGPNDVTYGGKLKYLTLWNLVSDGLHT